MTSAAVWASESGIALAINGLHASCRRGRLRVARRAGAGASHVFELARFARVARPHVRPGISRVALAG